VIAFVEEQVESTLYSWQTADKVLGTGNVEQLLGRGEHLLGANKALFDGSMTAYESIRNFIHAEATEDMKD
jgi:hypothetical protein